MQKLSFLGAYLSLLVPAGIGLVAVFIFLFSGVLGGKLIGQIEDESVSAGKRVKSGLKGTVPRNQWKVEQGYQQVYEADANHISLLGIQSTQRELLSYKLFPEPKETSTLIFDGFGKQFRKKIEAMISGINAADCPSESELERYLKSSDSDSGPRRRSRGSKSDEVNSTIKDVLCQARAESASVYGNATDLSGYEYWAEYEYIGMEEAIAECWYWQLAYWIIEDVISAIGSTNSGSSSVFTSPVKRILHVGFSTSSPLSSRTSVKSKSKSKSKRKSRGKSKSEEVIESVSPFYILSEDGGLTKSFTARFTNEEIDVVHFALSVLISNKKVLRFMDELCNSRSHIFKGFDGKGEEQTFKHNQITILKSNISSIDRDDKEHELYRYGDDAVVELFLVCEYVFNRKGYEAIMPKSVVEETIETGEED